MVEGLRVTTLSRQLVMRARTMFVGGRGMMSFSDGQHSLMEHGLISLPVAVRNACTRGLTCGSFPHLQFPRNVQWMLPLCAVSSKRRPPPIVHPFFLLCLEVAIAQSPCCLGGEDRT